MSEFTEANRIGEIIETETALFVAESFYLHRPPALGQLVSVENPPGGRIYAVVCHGTTASPDPGRRAVRRSTDEVYDEAIYHEHPQLEHTLRTEFTARLVGYSEDESVRQYLPPQPPLLHYSVHCCAPESVRPFTDRLTYLRLLLDAVELPAEHLLGAHIRWVYEQRAREQAWIERAARHVAGLLKSDYDRLMTVLYSIDVE